MPNLSTRGAGSSYAYGMGLGVKPPLFTGSFGIFVSAAANSPLTLYDFATTNATVISYLGIPEQYYGAAAGNAQKGMIFMAGRSAPFNTTKRYVFADGTSSAGTLLTQATSAGTAFGDAVHAIVILAYGDVVTNKYVYASDAVSIATSVTVGSVFVGSTGNADYAITQIGTRGNSGNNKYTYAGDVVTVHPTFATFEQMSGASIPATGIIAFAGGSTLVLSYASGTTVAGPAATGGGAIGSGCGNNNVAVFTRDSNSATSVYSYASNTFAAGTAYASFAAGGTALSNGVTGVNS